MPGSASVAAQSFEDDVRRIVQFLDELKRLLGTTVTVRRDLFGEHHDSLEAAWATVEPRFDTVQAGLELAGAQTNGEAFEARGLTGHELTLKLELFQAAKDDFERFVDAQDDVHRVRRTSDAVARVFRPLRVVPWVWRGVEERLRKFAKSALGRALEIADVPLGSLGKALDVALGTAPGVATIYGAAVEGIAEFKDSAKHAAGPDAHD